MQETWVRSLGREDPLEKEMATHSSTLAWRIPWREEPGRTLSVTQAWTLLVDYSPWGHKELDTTERLHLLTYGCPEPPFTFCSLVAKLCLTFCHPMDCSPPGSSVQVIFQARIMEQVAISFSRESSWPRDRTHISRVRKIPLRIFHWQMDSLPLNHGTTREAWR